jgi:peptidoglycan hydrolase-like protein with peptidoglycan-binding domain
MPILGILLLVPWSLVIWAVAQSHLLDRFHASSPTAPSPLPPEPGQGNAAAYVAHLNEAAKAAALLDLVKPLALSADIDGLMSAPEEISWALHALGAPMDVLTVQRDLNLLGASPPLSETGRINQETSRAIAALQDKFGQPVTGRVNPGTAVAIRYAVGCVYSQDRSGT